MTAARACCLAAFAVVLFVAMTIRAESATNFQKNIRPPAESCKESTNATDEDVDAMVYLYDNFTEEAKCLVACVAVKMGTFKDGRWVSFEEHLEVYEALFADDPKRLAHAKEIVGTCTTRAEEKFGNQSCDVAHDTLVCLLKTTNY